MSVSGPCLFEEKLDCGTRKQRRIVRVPGPEEDVPGEDFFRSALFVLEGESPACCWLGSWCLNIGRLRLWEKLIQAS